MFATYELFTDSKENITASPFLKTGIQRPNKGSKEQSIKSFKESTNIKKNRQNVSERVSKSKHQYSSISKENIKQTSKKEILCKTKSAAYKHEEEWPDIEEMHISIEPDDDYEDIMPKSERIQQSEIDFLFSIFPVQRFTDCNEDTMPAPPEIEDVGPEIVIPSFIQNESAALYDDTPLAYIPEPFYNL